MTKFARILKQENIEKWQNFLTQQQLLNNNK
jgi:hypothetical protein